VSVELVIVTPSGEAYRGEVERVVLPGSEGDFGVLEGHERFLCSLRTGEIQLTLEGGGSLRAAVAGGFADVGGSEAVVLAESCETADEIDFARAEHARTRAEEALASLDAVADPERFLEHDAALRRAVNRILVAEKGL
jgi:F-type H+-transporting ATPase subunit epsilon